jgi:uncharacterized membrane protein
VLAFLGSNPVGAVLAFMIVMTFIGFLVLLMFAKVPAENIELVREMMIALIAALGAGYGYYLGSSNGSARKTELMKSPEGPVV